MLRLLWFKFAMAVTGLLPDLLPTMKFRGLLVSPVFRSCGKNLQLAHDVRIAGVQNLTIGDDVFFSGGVWIQAGCSITFEDQVMLGPYVVVTSGDHSYTDSSWRFGTAVRSPVKIGRGAWIGSHGVVTKGVTIGKGACIAAGSIVAKDIPDAVLAGGAPALPIKNLE